MADQGWSSQKPEWIQTSARKLVAWHPHGNKPRLFYMFAEHTDHRIRRTKTVRGNADFITGVSLGRY